MSDEIRTAVDLRASIVDQRGGIERFDGPQRRLLDALVFELAKRPDEIDVRVVTDLMAMLPRPVSAPESSRDDRDAAVAPLLKLYRHLHESVHTLSAENAQLRAALKGGAPALPEGSYGLPSASGGHSTGDGRSTVIDPVEADITPPGEIGVARVGIERGPDDPRRRSTRVIDAKANPPAAPAAPKYDCDIEQGWRDHVLPDGTITPTPMSRGRWWGPV